MNDRERFVATMHYQPRDRAPLFDFNFWEETLPEWHKQGLLAWVDRSNSSEFFGLDESLFSSAPQRGRVGVDVRNSLLPEFEAKVIEDRGDHELVQQADGVRVLRRKYMSSIPMHDAHLLEDRASWNKHYKPRLDPHHPDRLPANWDAQVRAWTDPRRDWPIYLPGGSLYGWLRDWMGVENLSYVVYDDPAFFEEMLNTLADLTLHLFNKILSTGARFEACAIWEDMCYNGGPLLAPEHFKRYLVPQYQRITSLLHKHGVDVVWVDCDGKIDELIPLWLEAGVNCMFPIEIGTWDADPIEFRKQYGKELLLMGGVSKRVLARSKRDIEAEIRRLAPLVEQGGYIPMPDHRVPPDVPLENYIYYCRTARAVWGKGVNLPPAKMDV